MFTTVLTTYRYWPLNPVHTLTGKSTVTLFLGCPVSVSETVWALFRYIHQSASPRTRPFHAWIAGTEAAVEGRFLWKLFNLEEPFTSSVLGDEIFFLNVWVGASVTFITWLTPNGVLDKCLHFKCFSFCSVNYTDGRCQPLFPDVSCVSCNLYVRG